jgi:major membrane immunogen (membrane-anchored lipoprotein)
VNNRILTVECNQIDESIGNKIFQEILLHGGCVVRFIGDRPRDKDGNIKSYENFLLKEIQSKLEGKK